MSNIASFQTASCLTFCVYMMAEYPHMADRLRKEIIGSVGEGGRPSYDDIRDMKYLRAFINGKHIPTSSFPWTINCSCGHHREPQAAVIVSC